MSLSALLLGVWLILVGLVWALKVDISLVVLGWLAIITGVIWILEHVGVVGPVGRAPAQR